MSIQVDAHKVPGERSCLALDFTAHNQIGADLPAVRFGVDGVHVEVVEPADNQPADLSGSDASGTITIKLKEDGWPYKIFIVAFDDGGNPLGNSDPLYARMVQGNALILTEKQYDHFTEEFHNGRMEEKANERALEVLQELKANGLKVAVENWPHEEEFAPIQNSMGLNIVADQQDITMNTALIKQALQNPDLGDSIIIENIKPGDDPCYEAHYMTIDPGPVPLPPIGAYGTNVLAEIDFHADQVGPDIYDPSITDYGDTGQNMQFQITTRAWVYDHCHDQLKIKDVVHPVRLDENGHAVVTIGYAPSEPYPIKRVKAIAWENDIMMGRCYKKDPAGPDSIDCYAPRPVLDSNTYTAMLQDVGMGMDDIENQIELWPQPSTSNPYYHENWLVYAHYRLSDTDPYVRPFLPAVFPTLQAVKDKWPASNDRTNFRACYYHGDTAFRDPACGNPVITYNVNDARSFWLPFVHAHEAGHWFHYKLQHNWNADTVPDHSTCMATTISTAWEEGFADFFANYSGFTGFHFGFTKNYSGDVNSTCGSYAYPFITEGNIADFLWDIFDNIEDPDSDQGLDTFSMGKFAIESWSGIRCNDITYFITSGKGAGMPFEGHEDEVCNDQILHGLIYGSCEVQQ